MEVELLKWKEDDANWWGATSSGFPFGYEVRETDRGAVRYRIGSFGWDAYSGTVEEAKGHCQEDYRMRVLSCFESNQQTL